MIGSALDNRIKSILTSPLKPKSGLSGPPVRWRTSNETKPLVNHHVSAHDPVDDVAPDERYDSCQSRDARGRGLNPRCGARPGALVVRNAGARRASVGVHHHAHRVDHRAGHADHPRDGSGRHFSRPDRQVEPSLLVRLDAACAGCDWDVLLHPCGARTVEPATGPTPSTGMKVKSRWRQELRKRELPYSTQNRA